MARARLVDRRPSPIAPSHRGGASSSEGCAVAVPTPGGDLFVDQDRVAEVFALGQASGPARALRGGSSGRVWDLHTSEGRWVVKTQAAPEDWRRSHMVRAHTLERAAYIAGLPMARPVTPPEPSVGFWHDIDGTHARVLEFVENAHPVVVDSAVEPGALAAWLGRTLASIEQLGVPGDLSDDASTPLHPLGDWREWISEARCSEAADTACELLPAVERSTALVQRAEAAGPDALLGHRDIGPANVLRSGSGFRLIDWDHAGPAVPWWEAVHTAFRFAGGLDDARATRPEVVRAVLAAHRAAGGAQGPADESALAGLLRATLGFTAYTLWLSLGHRGGDALDRARAAVRFRAAAGSLQRGVAALPEWCALLR
ncbi:aminoglycoside phosphotransferase family protein [Streptomyces sp. LHD-70]|uniref:aminoglycoside phosphotransferase family protein n=1 Tax=Streptomyces sp. LHD-70 TaxID=3072140 RepID=UPI00280C71F7|nr:aminoglycoside phosphotransferase family protein [Streptomyces sp. LHD-70]MDQ8701673.1 aminoglycoside phosphotransferase family protein [Streptomyces sp. LHD-70]